MPVILKNKTRRMVIFNLPHTHACTETTCSCGRMRIGVTDHHPKTGVKTVRAMNKRVPASVTLLAYGDEGDTSKPLPDGVGRISEIVDAKRRGDLVVTYVPDPSTTPVADAPATE